MGGFMGDDEKMLRIGAWFLGTVLLMSVVLQVSFRTQNRAINRVRRDIVHTQQKIALAEANFASLVRPEVLRNSVVGMFPKTESVSFRKTVAIDELVDRNAQ